MNSKTESIGEHLDPTWCRNPCVTGSFMMSILAKKIYY